jgi:hypothetical protein
MVDTNGPMAAVWAVVLGLDVVERFMTLFRGRAGQGRDVFRSTAALTRSQPPDSTFFEHVIREGSTSWCTPET